MKTCRAIRGLLSFFLAAALFLFFLPRTGNAEAVWQKITATEELTTGAYVLVTADGYAPGILDGAWVTDVRPGISGDAVTDAGGALWTLTVEDGTVTMTDSRGVTIVPRSDGDNGIAAGTGSWSVTCEAGLFSFHSFSGEAPVTFAANPSADYRFRAYKDSAILAGANSYPCAFALYKYTEAPSQPEEAVVISAIHAVKSAAPGTKDLTIQGTVILREDASLILQDATGGLRVWFQNVPDAACGDILQITGSLGSDGRFTASRFESLGTGVLPAAEVTLEAILADQDTGMLENTRVLIRNVLVGVDCLTQEGVTVPAVLQLSETAGPGEPVDVWAVILRQDGYLLSITDISGIQTEAPEDRSVLWRRAAPEEILPTDTVAVTMTKAGLTWALCNDGSTDYPPEAQEVTVDGDAMRSAAEETLSWNLHRDETGLILFQAGSADWLYTSDKNNSVRVGTAGDGHWSIEDGYLKHVETGRYLSVYEGSLWRALTNHAGSEASGQSLSFWILDPPETVAAVAMTPAGGALTAGKDSVILSCATEGASIFYALSSDGENYGEYTHYTQPLSPEPGFGTLYVKAYAAKEGCIDSPETVCVFTEVIKPAWKAFFGQLHAHTDISDGTGTVEEALAHAAGVEGLDFFAVTDHSNSFDNAKAGAIAADGTAVSAEWAAGKAAAEAVTDGSFVGIFGYEMTWQDQLALGHISTFNTPGWQTRDQAAYSVHANALENYYEALTTVPGSVSQFNHPGPAYGDFEDFSHYDPRYDEGITLLEVGGENGFIAYESYTRALDAGWHVAPTNNQNNHNGSWGDESAARTVVLAESLSEESLYDALRNYRVYATQDSDLEIYYELSGNIMGSILSGPVEPEITVTLLDPTDDAIGTLEVIADGGAVVTSQAVGTSSETVTLSAPAGYAYYYLRITQPDGDIAVTAPVWVDDLEDVGIRSFSSDTEVPSQNQEIRLNLELFNDEREDFVLDSLVFTVDGEVVHTAEHPGTVPAMGSFSLCLPYTHSGLGVTEFQVTATGTVCGQPRSCTQTLILRYRVPELITQILVDGAHGNAGVDQLNHLTDLAADVHIGVTVFSGELPENGSVLLISVPSAPFDTEFLTAAAEFVQAGGSIIVCGQSDAGDTDVHTSAELNRLLAAVGSTLRLNDDTAADEENSTDAMDEITSTVFNLTSPWCEGFTADNFYVQHFGCTVNVGSGTWLVKGVKTTHGTDMDGDGPVSSEEAVLLAAEETPWGGNVLVSGGLFLSDTQMIKHKNALDPVRANQLIAEKLLNIERIQWPLSTVAQVRSGEQGQVYRIRGYATSGTANPWNTFANTLYVQDDTGGIPVVPFTETGIEVGTPMEVMGYLGTYEGNPALMLIGYAVLDADAYRYVPATMPNSIAMDYDTYGGRLMQVQGTLVSAECARNGVDIRRIILEDNNGVRAEILIEDYILSGANGVNRLTDKVKTGRTIRAIGILHLDEDGNPVLRVRNCDEVVYVPPVMNPFTGDQAPVRIAMLLASAAALIALLYRRKRLIS